MRQFTAFFYKEMMEMVRSGKFLILTIVFILFGIMNPAIAKLTPWIMELTADSLAETGIMVTEVKVDALISWGQYYKNIGMGIIVFLLIFGSILTIEYQKRTLINMVTKGLARWKIVLSKTAAVVLMWTFLYWLCFGMTYGYNAYFWDNGIANHVFFAAFCIYILGIWLISLVIVMSTIVSSGSLAVLLTGGVFGVFYIMSLLADFKEWLPVQLMNAGGLLTGNGGIEDYRGALVVSGVMAVLDILGAVLVFDRRDL